MPDAKIGTRTVHVSFLWDGRLFRDYESLYRSGQGGSVEIVYEVLDGRGCRADGAKPYYRELPEAAYFALGI